MPRRRDKRTDT